MPILELLPFSFAEENGVIITDSSGDKAEVVFKGELSIEILQEVQRFVGKPLELKKITAAEFSSYLVNIYEGQGRGAQEIATGLGDDVDLSKLAEEIPETQDLLENDDDAPIIRLLNAIFKQAIKQDSSDIHIETFEGNVKVRFRIDGVLHIVLEPPRILSQALVSRIKVMARLDIAEKRIPQDGRISLKLGGRNIDVRVSTMPTNFGERVVMRILDRDKAKLNLKDLGMTPKDLKKMEKLIYQPHGIIMVTGPTGSGKTTTLYAALTDLNNATRNILTVEDPIEYDLPGVGQTQVNTKVDMTFARGLRAILRQDPDVVMIGEIRDVETAEVAIQASLTGHLVLSTLHTNTAIGSITRMRDMGVQPFLISSSLIGVIAQRLVRRLCSDCRKLQAATELELKALEITKAKTEINIYKPVGCDKCNKTGYAGRTAIYEIVEVDNNLRELVHEGASEQDMEKYIRPFTLSMYQDGIEKVLQGLTSLEEVARVTSDRGNNADI